MSRQSEVTPSMRAVLVDWLVEVQENFELNHETLYLAVRLVDHYLAKHDVSKELLQLVGAAAVFIGCKFDVRFTFHLLVRMLTSFQAKIISNHSTW